MEFEFDAGAALQINQDGFAIIDAANPPSYMRNTGYNGFGA